VRDGPYTIEAIKSKIAPVAKKYNIPAVYLFGSYARGDASVDSDIDIIIDRTGSAVRSLLDMGSVRGDLEDIFGKDNVDIVTLNSILNPMNRKSLVRFAESVNMEKVKIYEQQG
jgi:predicted nucleotidyltransferase